MLLWFLQVQTLGRCLCRNVWRSWYLRCQSCPQQRWKRLYHWGESMGNLNVSLLWEVYLQALCLGVHVHQRAHPCMLLQSLLLRAHLHPQAMAHWCVRNWFRAPAKLADTQQSVRVEMPSFLSVDCERKWRVTECLATSAFQQIIQFTKNLRFSLNEPLFSHFKVDFQTKILTVPSLKEENKWWECSKRFTSNLIEQKKKGVFSKIFCPDSIHYSKMPSRQSTTKLLWVMCTIGLDRLWLWGLKFNVLLPRPGGRYGSGVNVTLRSS